MSTGLNMSTGRFNEADPEPVATIRVAGALADRIVIDYVHSSCGPLRDDLSCYFSYDDPHLLPGMRGGWVMSWEDFEAAYHALKAARSDTSSNTQEGSNG